MRTAVATATIAVQSKIRLMRALVGDTFPRCITAPPLHTARSPLPPVPRFAEGVASLHADHQQGPHEGAAQEDDHGIHQCARRASARTSDTGRANRGRGTMMPERTA